MNRDDTISIGVAVLCIMCVGVVASTLLSAQLIGASGEVTPMETQRPMEMVGIDDPEDPDEVEGNESVEFGSGTSGITTCVPALDTPLALLGVLSIFLVLVFLIYRRFNVALAMLSAWTIFPPIMLVYFVLTDCTSRDTGGLGGLGGSGVSIRDAGSSFIPISDVPVWVIPLLVVAVVIGAALVLYRSAGADEVVIPDEMEADEEPDLDSFAHAAGRAADRIEEHNVNADNSVYQAWVEMTGLLDVDEPETYTAGEFAEAATGLGMASEDINELTTLFNEVRYGGKDAETREDHAVDILRNIESQYRDETVTERDPDVTDNDNNVQEGNSQ